jgi:hypothetical protein
MQANRFAKWAGSYRPSFENAGLRGLTLPRPQAFRGVEPGQPSNPSAAERGLTGLKSASALVQPRRLMKSEARSVQIVSIPTPAEGCSNPSNPKPEATGLTPHRSKTEEIRGSEAVQTRQTHQTPDLNDAEHRIVPCAATGPVDDTLKAWRAWMNRRLPVQMARGPSRAKAMGVVWTEAECIWHCRHGAPPDPDRCAGCGEWMLDGPGMRFKDGAVVHLGNPDRFDCLILYGQEWRATASAGLIALGLNRPEP